MRNFVIYFSLIFLVSCFGTKRHNQNSANGVALDGYLYLATAFIDFDGDGIQDGDEPSGSTDANGNYAISSNLDISSFRVVIKGVENVTIDQDNPGTAITSAFTFLTPPGEFGVASPMTTEIVARMNDGLDKDAAIAAIKSDYGFADHVDITKDYIAEKVTNSAYAQMHNIAAAITVVLQAVESSNSSATSLANKLRSMKNNIQGFVGSNVSVIKQASNPTQAVTRMKENSSFNVDIRLSQFNVYLNEQVTLTSHAVSLDTMTSSDIAANKCSFDAFDVDNDATNSITEIAGSFTGGTATDASTNSDGSVSYGVTFDTEGDYTIHCTIEHTDNTIKTNSITFSVTEAPVTHTGLGSDGPYLSACYNQLGAACAGDNCAAGSVSGSNSDGFTTQLSGSGYGIWCYDNQESSAASVDLSISGLSNARVATFVFTNPDFSSSTKAVPTLGDLTDVAQPPAEINFDANSDIHFHPHHTSDPNQKMHEQNRLLRNEMKEPDPNEILFEQNNANLDVISIDFNDQTGNTLNVGDTHTFREGYHCDNYPGSTDGCIEYDMTARHICTLSPVAPHTVGRRVVFWIESGAVKNTLGDRSNPASDGIYGSGNMFDGQEKISSDDLAVLTDTVCTGTGKGGGFDKLVSLTGDFWTTHDTYYSNIMSEESINSPIDLNILIIEPEECGSHGSAGEVAGCNSGWAGYFGSIHTFKALDSSNNPAYWSNQSLVFFIDGSGVANSPQFYTSTLVHEAMHMINSTYQSYAVMSNNANNSVDTNLRWDHETWLEEVSAISAEDLIVPHASMSALSSSSYPEGYSKLENVRIRGYAGCDNNQNLSEWASLGSSSCAYGMGGALGGFLNRRYGPTWFTYLFNGFPNTGLTGFDECDTNGSGSSYECLNAVLRSLNSRSLSSSQYVDNMMLHDELARMGASVYATDESSGENIYCNSGYTFGGTPGGRNNSDCAGKGISDTNLPGGFGYPDKTSLDDSLFGLDLSSDQWPRPVTNSSSFNGSSHFVFRHHLYDSSGASDGDSLSINGLSVPPGTSMMLIIK